MEISFRLLQQQNPWWFREELILDDEKIADYERNTYRYLPPILTEFPQNADAVLTLRGPRQIGKSTSAKLLIRKLLLESRSLSDLGDRHEEVEERDQIFTNLRRIVLLCNENSGIFGPFPPLPQ